MSWSVGFDSKWNREIGYGVPANCDHPDCEEEINRGLGYVCGSEAYGGDDGCGLFFCDDHKGISLCKRCELGEDPFEASPDILKWIKHKMSDPTWKQWRVENKKEVAKLRKKLRQNDPRNWTTKREERYLDDLYRGPNALTNLKNYQSVLRLRKLWGGMDKTYIIKAVARLIKNISNIKEKNAN